MALYTCRKCGKRVPMQYEICPYCRTPRPEAVEDTEPVPQKKKKHPILRAILASLGMVTVIVAVGVALALIIDANKGPTDGAESDTVFGVGDQVSVDDVLVTLVDAYEHEGEYFSIPEDGNVFVVFEFEIENNSSRDITVASIHAFDAYVDDYSINDSYNDLNGYVAPGKKMNGVIGYEVPRDWKTIEIKFTPYYGSHKNVTFTYSK